MVDIRPVDADELETYVRTTSTAFGGRLVDDLVEPLAASIETKRAFVAEDGGTIVGTGGTWSLELTVPGDQSVPTGGLTWIGVLPTHRRRGILSQMMRRHLENVVAHGEAVGALFASEAAIYGRFGYGIATLEARYEIETKRSAFLVPVRDEGSIRLVDRDTALEVIPGLHERVRRTRVGDVSRSPQAWRAYIAEWEQEASGWQSLLYVLHEDRHGDPDGYAMYRIGDEEWPHGLARSRVDVPTVGALTEATRAALWRYLLDLDLVASVRMLDGPVDEPMRWRLADPRQLRTMRVSDGLWLRLVDVPAALSARRYESERQVTFEVRDELLPDVAGTFELDAGPDGASCTRTGKAADLVFDVDALGSVYLGGIGVAALAAAGRVEESRPGAVAAADRLFATARTPYCPTTF